MRPRARCSLVVLAICFASSYAKAEGPSAHPPPIVVASSSTRPDNSAPTNVGANRRAARTQTAKPTDKLKGSLDEGFLGVAKGVGIWAGGWLVLAFIAVAKFGTHRRAIFKWPVVATFSLVPIFFLAASEDFLRKIGVPPVGWIPMLTGVGFMLVAAFAASRQWDRVFPVQSPDIHGSAKWATARDAVARGRVLRKGRVLADSYGFALGRMPKIPWGRDPRLRYMGHVLTCAPTGAGKGIGAVIPNLLEYPGSALVLDVKGENFAVTARARQRLGHSVFLVDPFGVTGATAHRCNWLDRLKPSDPNVVSESAMLADMLVIPDATEGSYWDDSARDLLRGLLLHVAALEGKDRHMGHLRRLLTGGEATLNEVLARMASTSTAFGVVASAANAFMAKADRDRSGVLSTAIRHTSFLDDPRIVAALSSSDFSLDDLKRRPMTVYLALPPGKLSAYSRLMRGFVGLALAGITATKDQPRFKVALFLDEFPQLGRMAAVEDSISIVRGYGAVFWIFVQDLSQLKAVYPKWQGFLANSAKQFFSTSDLDTARYISQSLGEATIEYRTSGRHQQDGLSGSSGTNDTQHFAARALLTPDEVMRLGPVPITLINGEPPYILRRLNYLTDPEYRGLADPNPFHAAA